MDGWKPAWLCGVGQLSVKRPDNKMVPCYTVGTMSKRKTAAEIPRVMGRPRKFVDMEQFEKLCELLCTLREIAGWFQVSEDTIENRCKEHYEGRTFSDVYKYFSAPGKISLRRAQFTSALGGNVTAQIWLGKQILGQRDIPETGDNEGGEHDVVKGLADIKRKAVAHGSQQSPGFTSNDANRVHGVACKPRNGAD